jgi:hypothetical protein
MVGFSTCEFYSLCNVKRIGGTPGSLLKLGI